LLLRSDAPDACLTGAVPSELGTIRNKQDRGTDSDDDGGLGMLVMLWGNNLTGSIPSEMALLPLDMFDVDNNTALSGCNPLPFNITHLLDTNITGPCTASLNHMSNNSSAQRTTSPSNHPQAASAGAHEQMQRVAGVAGDASRADATTVLFLSACAVALVGVASYRNRRVVVAAAVPHDESLTKLIRPDTSEYHTYHTTAATAAATRSASAAAVPSNHLQSLAMETGGGPSSNDSTQVRSNV
jgi:hypothetical protein